MNSITHLVLIALAIFSETATASLVLPSLPQSNNKLVNKPKAAPAMVPKATPASKPAPVKAAPAPKAVVATKTPTRDLVAKKETAKKLLTKSTKNPKKDEPKCLWQAPCTMKKGFECECYYNHCSGGVTKQYQDKTKGKEKVVTSCKCCSKKNATEHPSKE